MDSRELSTGPGWLVALAEPSSVAAFTPAEWTEALWSWRRAGVAGWIATAIPDRALVAAPPGAIRQVETARRQAAFDRSRTLITCANLERALAESGVASVVLKGASHILAGRRPGSGRLMDDVDLLVHPDALDTAAAALRAGGWRSRPELVPDEETLRRRLSHQLPERYHPELQRTLDLHVGLLGPAGASRAAVEALLAAALPAGGGTLRVPAPADAVVVAAAHLDRTLDTGAALRDLLDVHLLVSEAGLAWEAVMDRAATLGLAGATQRALRLAHATLGTAFPDVTPRRLSPGAVTAWLPPPPTGDPAAVRIRRRWIEWWALRHSWRLRAAIGSRRLVARAGTWWEERRAPRRG